MVEADNPQSGSNIRNDSRWLDNGAMENRELSSISAYVHGRSRYISGSYIFHTGL